MHLQELDCLGLDDLAVHSLGSSESDLALVSIELIESLDVDSGAVSNPVVAHITECDDVCAGCDCRCCCGFNRETAESVRLALCESRLPDVVAVAVLELADCLDCGIVQEEPCVSSVRSLDAVDQVNDLVCSDLVCCSSSDSDLSTVCGEESGWLLDSVSGAEGCSVAPPSFTLS